MSLTELIQTLAAHRAHARQTTTMLRALRDGDTTLAAVLDGVPLTRTQCQAQQQRAAWEAGQPVRSAAQLAALLAAPRTAMVSTGREYQAKKQRQARDPDHLNIAAWEAEHAAEIRARISAERQRVTGSHELGCDCGRCGQAGLARADAEAGR